MSVFSDKNALTATNWLAKMDEDIFDEYVVVENTSERADENTSYRVDVTDYNDRIADQLLTLKEDYSDIYGPYRLGQRCTRAGDKLDHDSACASDGHVGQRGKNK